MKTTTNKLYDINLTIGHNVDDVPTLSGEDIYKTAAAVLSIDAFTAFDCVGYWRGIPEKSTRIEICAVSDDRAEEIRSSIPALASALGQEAIMLKVVPSVSTFICAA